MNKIAHQIYKSIVHHTTWKKHLHEMIESCIVDEDLSEEVCEFGQWLKENFEELKGSEHYSKVVELHHQVHKEAQRIITLALSGKREEALVAIAYGSEFEHTSQLLVQNIIAWHDAVK